MAWDGPTDDLQIGNLWDDGSDVLLCIAREPPTLTAEDEVSPVFLQGEEEPVGKPPTPPPSGGADAEMWLDQFLVSDEKPVAEAAILTEAVSASTTAPASPSASPLDTSSFGTPAPLSPEDGTPPPTGSSDKRKRDEDDGTASPWDGESSRGRSPESVVVGTNSHYRSMVLRPEDDPAGLFQRDPKTLTCEELKVIKKQKRLIKNRESAQLSRHRKKQHVEGLQTTMHTMEKERNDAQARVAELVKENAALKAQLAAAGLSLVAETSSSSATGASVAKVASSMALACVFAVGLLFTGTNNLRPARLPTPAAGLLGGGAGSSLTAYHGPRRGRVLLSTEEAAPSNFEPFDQSGGLGDRKQLLIVTLLDHIVGGTQKPALFARLCTHLGEMGVLDGCGFLGSMGDVRAQYLSEFASLHEEFAKSGDEDAAAPRANVEADFTVGGGGSKALANHVPSAWGTGAKQASKTVPLDLPTVPLPMGTDGLWGLLKGKGLRSKFNVLCPSAKFLIADAVSASGGLGGRLAGKERLTNSTLPPPPMGERMGGLSMVLPSSAIGTNPAMGNIDDGEEDGLVELRCEAFDIRPISREGGADSNGLVRVR